MKTLFCFTFQFGNNISKYISLLKLVLIVMDIMQQNGIYATHIFRHSRSNVLYRQGAVAGGLHVLSFMQEGCACLPVTKKPQFSLSHQT